MSDIESQVCADIKERQEKGITKYGMTVAQNPAELREWLQHAYEETLDKAIYLKRAIAEIDTEATGEPRRSNPWKGICNNLHGDWSTKKAD